MKYKQIVRGTFIERPNRFIAKVNIGGKTETVHVKNTGRCKELLVPGAVVYLEKSENEQMKIMWRLYYIQFPKYILGLEKNIIQCFKVKIFVYYI